MKEISVNTGDIMSKVVSFYASDKIVSVLEEVKRYLSKDGNEPSMGEVLRFVIMEYDKHFKVVEFKGDSDV